MATMGRLVLTENLSPKWSKLQYSRTEWHSMSITRCGGEAKEILAECRRLSPCLLVVSDTFMDGIDRDVFRAAADFGRSILVLVEVGDDDPGRDERFLRIGCSGVLPKTASLAEARRALGVVLSGELYAAARTISGLLRSVLWETGHSLTAREAEILRLMAQGLKNQEIAKRLFISVQTVRWHLRGLYGKFGSHDRSAVMASVRTRNDPFGPSE